VTTSSSRERTGLRVKSIVGMHQVSAAFGKADHLLQLNLASMVH
jgi:hypothetical protein